MPAKSGKAQSSSSILTPASAPNAGSISLQGEWFSLGLDFRKEYEALKEEEAAQQMDDEFQGRMLNKRTMSSFRGDLAANLR